jgi:polar amino acid transport system substrate-binding protein
MIFTSGYPSGVIQDKGLFEEGLNYVPKPVSPVELLKKLREVLDKRQ